MRPFYYLLSEEQAKKYAETKTAIITARSQMSETEAKAAREDIIREVKVNDFNPEKTDNLFTVQNDIAIIPIVGMLVQKVDICAGFFGETVTTYRFVQEAVIKAENDPRIKSILFDVNSGGGELSGCEQTFQTILRAEKPTFSAVHDMAASAAFWLASAADEIISVSKTGFFGSIGVAVEITNHDEEDKSRGIKRTVITNTTSADKRPDLTTKAGKSVIIDELNAIFKVFSESILVKRSGKLTQKSIEDLSGKVLISEDAIDFGLADIQLSQDQVINHIETQIKGDDNDIFAADQNINYDNDAFQGNRHNSVITGPTTGIKKKNNTSHDVNNTTPEGENMEEAMNFKEFLDSNPDAKAAYEKNIATAKAEGVELGKAEMQTRIDATVNFIGNENYPGIETLAKDVLTGKAEVSALKGAVVAFDMLKGTEKSTDAKKETDELGETNPEQPKPLSEDGKIENEAAFKVEQDKNRKMFGMEVVA